jgi:hypothetical protein
LSDLYICIYTNTHTEASTIHKHPIVIHTYNIRIHINTDMPLVRPLVFDDLNFLRARTHTHTHTHTHRRWS